MSDGPGSGGAVVVVAPSERAAVRLRSALEREGFQVAQVVVAPVPAATVSAVADRAIPDPNAFRWQERIAALSPRELDVLQQLVDGTTRSEAAANLFITENTVRAHVRRVLAKTGARSSLEAVSIAVRAGMRPSGG